ncbi:MAG: carotenoid 1,2-hydratase [Shimia sp.]
MSDCGTWGVSIIGFVGSVFSPWYAWSGRRDPQDHVCLNVATYGPKGRFTMTDRGRGALDLTRDRLGIGPSSMAWEGDRLVIGIDEWSGLPGVGRVQGRVVLHPAAVTGVELPLTADGAHVWRPFAPVARIEVDLPRPGLRWQGHGYFDANFGTRALEQDFAFWTWGRFPIARGALCAYDAERLDGSTLGAAMIFDGQGRAEVLGNPPPLRPFARSGWRVRREARADAGYRPHQVKPMLDAPFYSRSAVRTQFAGEESVGVHEALDLRRFRSPLIKPMLAFRVPRRRG